jgi:hypothetical protein
MLLMISDHFMFDEILRGKFYRCEYYVCVRSEMQAQHVFVDLRVLDEHAHFSHTYHNALVVRCSTTHGGIDGHIHWKRIFSKQFVIELCRASKMMRQINALNKKIRETLRLA